MLQSVVCARVCRHKSFLHLEKHLLIDRVNFSESKMQSLPVADSYYILTWKTDGNSGERWRWDFLRPSVAG